MRNRILEIADSPAPLRVERQQLIIQTQEGEAHTIPLDDLAVVIVAHPQVSYTQAVLTELVAHGGTLVTCDRARLPVGLLLPIDAPFTQTERALSDSGSRSSAARSQCRRAS